MAHYAELNKDDIVKRVLVIDNEQEEQLGEEGTSRWLVASLGGYDWVKTSYNNTIRKNYAAIGYKYDRDLDAFIPPKPYPSWVLDAETVKWIPPIPVPQEEVSGKQSFWDEENQTWIFVDTKQG